MYECVCVCVCFEPMQGFQLHISLALCSMDDSLCVTVRDPSSGL